MAKNVLGGELKVCCTSPMTGFYRTGACDTGPEDRGAHIISVNLEATHESMLEFLPLEVLKEHSLDLIK